MADCACEACRALRAWGEAKAAYDAAIAAHEAVRYLVGPERAATREARDAAYDAYQRAGADCEKLAEAIVEHSRHAASSTASAGEDDAGMADARRIHAAALMHGYNHLATEAPSFGAKVYMRMGRERARREFEALGGEVRETAQAVTTVLTNPPFAVMTDRDIELMRAAVAERDAKRDPAQSVDAGDEALVVELAMAVARVIGRVTRGEVLPADHPLMRVSDAAHEAVTTRLASLRAEAARHLVQRDEAGAALAECQRERDQLRKVAAEALGLDESGQLAENVPDLSARLSRATENGERIATWLRRATERGERMATWLRELYGQHEWHCPCGGCSVVRDWDARDAAGGEDGG